MNSSVSQWPLSPCGVSLRPPEPPQSEIFIQPVGPQRLRLLVPGLYLPTLVPSSSAVAPNLHASLSQTRALQGGELTLTGKGSLVISVVNHVPHGALIILP